mmetsp:Transcript_69016/g.225018  ORF Transcript_69016/g.225018 Transcript_69016/m.225018 type:complete len:120 (+) Transcript_69016:1492-1851(+)
MLKFVCCPAVTHRDRSAEVLREHPSPGGRSFFLAPGRAWSSLVVAQLMLIRWLIEGGARTARGLCVRQRAPGLNETRVLLELCRQPLRWERDRLSLRWHTLFERGYAAPVSAKAPWGSE